MNEELELVIDACKEGMDAAIKHLDKQLLNIPDTSKSSCKCCYS